MKIHDDSSDLVIDEEGHAVTEAPVEVGPLGRAAYAIGSVGLLTATAADTIAVFGRHAGFAFLGSIEIIQVSVVLIASSAMVAATLVGSHASVHILTERLTGPTAARLARLASALSALFFLLLIGGSVWVLSDLWDGYEQTELLGISLRWFRMAWIAAALLILVLFAQQAVRRSR